MRSSIVLARLSWLLAPPLSLSTHPLTLSELHEHKSRGSFSTGIHCSCLPISPIGLASIYIFVFVARMVAQAGGCASILDNVCLV